MSVVGDEENFAINVLISDLDLINTGVASDTLSLSFSPTFYPASVTKSGLLSGGVMSASGSVTLILSATRCPDARYLCIFITPATGASYTELDGTNNVQCMDITARISCIVGKI